MIQVYRRAVRHAAVAALLAAVMCPGLASGQDTQSAASGASVQPAELEFSLSPASVALAADVTEEAPAPYNLLTTKKLTGDWFGIRPVLEDNGFNLSPVLVVMYQQNFRGGANTHNAHEIAGKWFYNVELDFGKMKLVPGATFFFRAVQTWNDGIRADVGTSIPPYWSAGSGGDYYLGDHNCILVDKWWYRQRLLDDRIEIRLGKLLNICDLFDRSPYAGSYASMFMNRTLSHNLTIPVAKGIGAYIKLWPTDWFYFQASGIDADNRKTRTGFDTGFHGPAHFMGNWEFGFTPQWQTAKGKLPGNYRFGWWYNPRVRPVFKDTLGGALSAPKRRNDDVGFYINFDQMVWKENDGPRDKQGLAAFFRYGYAHREVNRYAHAWSIGAQYLGLIPNRDADVLGFGVAQTISSSQYRHEIDSRADRETVYELYYAIKVTPWCVITPDIQVITNPGLDKDARDALVGGLRVKIAF